MDAEVNLMELIGYLATAIVSALCGAGGTYAIMRNNIKGIKEKEAEEKTVLLEQLNTERAKMRQLMDKLIAVKNGK
jgi:hypothetical protein